jgi:hypothetical protein
MNQTMVQDDTDGTASAANGNGHDENHFPEHVLQAMVDAFIAEQQKALAIGMGDITLAVKAASRSLKNSGRAQAAHLTEEAAEKLESCSNSVLRLNSGEIVNKVKDSARTHPWLYMGGSALVGALVVQKLCEMNRAQNNRR